MNLITGPNDWPTGHEENGNYSGECCQCGVKYLGPKRSIICWTCTEKNRAAWEALTKDEQDEMTRRFFAEWNEVWASHKEAVSPPVDQYPKITQAFRFLGPQEQYEQDKLISTDFPPADQHGDRQE